MARRGGKAASRRARQQRRNRPSGSPPPAAPRPAAPEEAVSASVATPAAVPASVAPVRRPSPVLAAAAHGSALTAHEREEYHYVGRDLRNIMVLVVIMFAILAAATIAINVL